MWRLRPVMAPEESMEAPNLLQSFERHFLAARALHSFPWQNRFVSSLFPRETRQREIPAMSGPRRIRPLHNGDQQRQIFLRISLPFNLKPKDPFCQNWMLRNHL
ncbi:hypothetical protein QTO34_003725 [Cnephaeus nilssonii]|uniref:Uncharacterized protein n=1 Tax=Cnephaeus nilssonii TaxID=3371016 RepID=A0AA40LJP7_CNENI|nr:hypothetical protein QTO34_003725 [Eptesicus nilssonii]